MKPIRVPDLSPEQLTELEELYRSTRKVRARCGSGLAPRWSCSPPSEA
jgi:hypothetical protein